jgi:indole-3-glycerol phosphate synthase
MNILDTIIAQKKIEVAERKQLVSTAMLEQQPFFSRSVLSLSNFLLNKERNGIIAEFKRKSPSKGIINGTASVVEITKAYAKHGASCISVLTDAHFFGGSTEDLLKARINEVPILRKDFIIDEYQILEAKAMGADVILLIAACLEAATVKRLAQFAQSLGLAVLLELHGENELDHICEETTIIGINNRDLKTFVVDIDRSLRMAEAIPSGKIKVAESGISSIENIKLFRQNGFSGFLIGENFMKEKDPASAFALFVEQLNNSTD